ATQDSCTKNLAAELLSRKTTRDSLLISRGASFGNGVVLLTRSTAHSHRANNLTIALQRNATSKDHDLAIVRCMDAEKLSARLAMGCEVFRTDIERPRCVSLLDRDIDASQPCAIHANMSDQVAARVRDRDVHRLTDFFGFVFCRSNNPSRIFQTNHLFLLVR